MSGLRDMFGRRGPRPDPLPPEARGTYCCFVDTVAYWQGPKAGETERLENGDWELQVITGSRLLWEYEDANSLHNGLPLELDYRPQGLAQLVAWRDDRSLLLRIGLDGEPMRFTGLGSHAALSGICFFKPQATR